MTLCFKVKPYFKIKTWTKYLHFFLSQWKIFKLIFIVTLHNVSFVSFIKALITKLYLEKESINRCSLTEVILQCARPLIETILGGKLTFQWIFKGALKVIYHWHFNYALLSLLHINEYFKTLQYIQYLTVQLHEPNQLWIIGSSYLATCTCFCYRDTSICISLLFP